MHGALGFGGFPLPFLLDASNRRNEHFRTMCCFLLHALLQPGNNNNNNLNSRFAAPTPVVPPLPYPPTRFYSQAAAFCYEELVLVRPSDHVVHCRLGEVYYTMGGKLVSPLFFMHFFRPAITLDASSATIFPCHMNGLCTDSTKPSVGNRPRSVFCFSFCVITQEAFSRLALVPYRYVLFFNDP